MASDNRMRLLVFLGLAFALSWGSFVVFDPLLPGLAAYVVFMFGPLVSALVTAALFDRGRIIAMLALKPGFNAWWIVAWLTPAVIVGLAWAVALLLPGTEPRSFAEATAALAEAQGVALEPGTIEALPPLWLIVLGAIFIGGAINTFVTIGEEAGWRGYLWTLIRPAGFWRATLVTGIVWGLWHTPVIADGHNYGTAYAGFPWLGVGVMVLFTLGLSPLLGLIRDRTGTSWAPALFHGTLNATGGLVPLLIMGGHPLVAGVAGFAGIAALAAVTAAVALMRPESAVLPDTRAAPQDRITSS